MQQTVQQSSGPTDDATVAGISRNLALVFILETTGPTGAAAVAGISGILLEDCQNGNSIKSSSTQERDG